MFLYYVIINIVHCEDINKSITCSVLSNEYSVWVKDNRNSPDIVDILFNVTTKKHVYIIYIKLIQYILGQSAAT